MFVAQSCPALCDSMDCSLEGFFLCPRNSPARILELVAIPFFRGSSRTRDQTWVSCIAGRFFTLWTISEALPSSQLSEKLQEYPCLRTLAPERRKTFSPKWLTKSLFLIQGLSISQDDWFQEFLLFSGNSILTFTYCDLICDSNKTITQVYWKEESRLCCSKNPRLQTDGSEIWKGLLCALHAGIRKSFFFFCSFLLWCFIISKSGLYTG